MGTTASFVYGLADRAGRIFYVGFTRRNLRARMYEHRYRAPWHTAPVYRYWRSLGLDSVTIVEIEPTSDPARETHWIDSLLASGSQLVNELSRDGVSGSWSPEMRAAMSASRKGKPTWIKGKRGAEAGWTDARKAAMGKRAEEHRACRVPRHGSRTEYVKYGCRCTKCSAEYSRLQSEYRVRTGRKKA